MLCVTGQKVTYVCTLCVSCLTLGFGYCCQSMLFTAYKGRLYLCAPWWYVGGASIAPVFHNHSNRLS
jgi:hypothetical protein